MAQLVERLVRNEEASGSNPLSSTKTKPRLRGVFFVLVKVTLERCIISGSREEANAIEFIFFLHVRRRRHFGVANLRLAPFFKRYADLYNTIARRSTILEN